MVTKLLALKGHQGLLRSGAVIFLTGCLLAAGLPGTARCNGLVLNELMAANDSTIADDAGEYDDWIEIGNAGSVTIDLTGLALTDNLENPQAFLFPAISLTPGDYLIVWADDEPEQGALHAPFKLTSDGEAVYLLDGATILDSTRFPALGTDVSWGRWPDLSGDWKIMGAATPGLPNQDPEPPVFGLFLNEVMADNFSCLEDPQEPGEYPDWIELYNGESFEIDLSGMYLSDDPAEPNKYEIPAGVTIAAHGFLVFLADDESDQGPLHTTFKLSSTGESIYLICNGYTIDETTFGTLGRDLSWGRLPDGNGEWRHLSEATPGGANQDPDYPAVALYINEFMADNATTIEDPDDPGQYPDWLELYNAESVSVDLSGMYLSDDPADPTKYPIPQGISIPAHGYLLFWADDESEQGPLHTNFKLVKSGEVLQVYHPDGITCIDYVAFEEQETDSSCGRFPDGTDNWCVQSLPTPGSGNVPNSSTGMTLFMDDRMLSAGDRCHVYFYLWPANAAYSTDVYLLLDVGGAYFSWPQWTPLDQGLGFENFIVYPGNGILEPALDFTWPQGTGAGTGLVFYGAAMVSGTYNLIGDLQSAEFSYE
ncbi:lamin tail domain-containing protein [bacterium]|nr:lamin tail domain-containing protein [candidate division CSSED10-310 bacterium]